MAQRKNLTVKQLKFIELLMAGENQQDAYVKAGYADGKYKYVQAYELRNKPLVAAELERRRAMVRERLVERLADTAHKSLDRCNTILDDAKSENKVCVDIAKEMLSHVMPKPKEEAASAQARVVVKIQYADEDKKEEGE